MREKRYISIIHKVEHKEYYIREHNNLLEAIEYIIIEWDNMSLKEKRDVLLKCKGCETMFLAVETLRKPDEIIRIFKKNPKLILDYSIRHFDLTGCVEYDIDLKLRIYKELRELSTAVYNWRDYRDIYDKANKIIYIRKENNNDELY